MDSEKYISNLKKKVDVIYIDLMFPGMGKSKAKREIQALRELVNKDINDNLLSVSLKKAFERVIVKRHKNSIFLSGKEPTYIIQGRATRYDIYSVKLIWSTNSLNSLFTNLLKSTIVSFFILEEKSPSFSSI